MRKKLKTFTTSYSSPIVYIYISIYRDINEKQVCICIEIWCEQWIDNDDLIQIEPSVLF